MQNTAAPAVLTPTLAEHYSRHDVTRLEEFLTRGGASGGASCRFVRLNPRFDRDETLKLLRVRNVVFIFFFFFFFSLSRLVPIFLAALPGSALLVLNILRPTLKNFQRITMISAGLIAFPC